MAVAASLCLDFARAAFAECPVSCLFCPLRKPFVSSRSVELRKQRQPFSNPSNSVVMFRDLLPLLVDLVLLLPS